MSDRETFLLSLFDHTGVGLEISPGYNPILPKSKGYRIETVDHAPADQLRGKYKNDPTVDITKIEDVDYVSEGASIAEVIKKRNYYDYVLASHVIEHIPDIIAFLKATDALLKDNGLLVLAIPDKRYCFDVFQSLTGTGEVLQAHIEKRVRHSPGSVFDFIAYRAIRDNRGNWNSVSDGDLSLEFSLEQAKEVFDVAQRSNEYHDIHGWRFTPSSFRLMINDLNEMSIISLRESQFHDTVGCEFYITLSRKGTGCPTSRLSLAKAIVEEQKAISVGAYEAV
jgi:hypothetical protein